MSTIRDQFGVCRLFLSSTFRDMQAERDVLVRLVLPRHRALLAKAKIALQEIDLRWGVTEALAQNTGAVAICLREIESCLPFVYGIIGHRIGWCPPRLSLDVFDPKFASKVPPSAGMTEIELRYAAHLVRSAATHLRMPVLLRSRRLSLELAPEACDWEGTEALRKWVASEPAFQLSEYDTLVDFERLADGELTRLFQADWRPDKNLGGATALPELDRSQDVAAVNRAAGWGGKPLLVTGERGIGTSWVMRRWCQSDPNGLYIDGREVPFHDLPVALGSIEPGGGLAAAWQETEAASALLTRLSGPARVKRIVLDHFDDMFSDIARADLSALPARLPWLRHIAVVANNPRVAAQGQQLGWILHRVRRAGPREAGRFVQSYLASFGKVLTPEQAAALQSAPWITNLSDLMLALDELRRFGAMEYVDKRIASLCQCRTSAQLAEELMAGLRSVLPQPWTDAADRALIAMRLSLRGLREDELRHACASPLCTAVEGPGTPLPTHLWSAIRVSLASSLVSRGALLDMSPGLLAWSDEKMRTRPQAVPAVCRAIEAYLLHSAPDRFWEEAPHLAHVCDPQHGLEDLLAAPEAALNLLETGESFADGTMMRLDEGARARVVLTWIQAATGLTAPAVIRLAHYAARTGDSANAVALLGRLPPDRPLPQWAILLTENRAQISTLAAELAVTPSSQRGESWMQGATIALAAAASGFLTLDAGLEQQIRTTFAARKLSPVYEGKICLHLGQIALVKAKWKDAVQEFARAERFGRKAGHAPLLCQSLERSSAAELERNRFKAARGKAAECRELAAKAGLGAYEALAFERLIEVECRRANWATAYELAAEYLRRCQSGLANPARAEVALRTIEQR